MAGRTIYSMFLESVQRHSLRPAVGIRQAKSESITYWTYSELSEIVDRMRLGLLSLGLNNGDRIAVMSENRVEWIVIDLAAQSLGIINVAPYQSLPAQQAAYIVRDSGSLVLFCSDIKQCRKAIEISPSCPDLKTIVSMDAPTDELKEAGIVSYDDLLTVASTAGDEANLVRLTSLVDPTQTALFIYTSGTTGNPKGAMLSHLNVLQTPDAVVDEPIADIGPGDRFLSFLPLSHITERVGGYYLPIRVGACIIFSLGLSQVGAEITEIVRPTCMICVPRIFDNMHAKFIDGLQKLDDKTRKKILWAIEVGTQRATYRSDGKAFGLIKELTYRAADHFILGKIREKVTGGNMRFFVSGGAPLNPVTAKFFLAIGIQILEGYGLSETNIVAINRPGKQRIGTVGTLLPKVEINIANDGELLLRGQGRMKGYYGLPEQTAEAIDADGWFHSGDIGEMSSDGYLKITDRKKDLIVLANGKKVAPQPIEALIKQSEFVGEAVLLGDRQSTVIGLLVPNFARLLEWAKDKGLTLQATELVNLPEVQKLFKSEIDKYATGLADYEKIKRFRVLDRPFSIESGELTPTLKVKRKFVADKYADIISGMVRAEQT